MVAHKITIKLEHSPEKAHINYFANLREYKVRIDRLSTIDLLYSFFVYQFKQHI